MTDKEYAKFVWDNADKTGMYNDVIRDLLEVKERVKLKHAKDENDYAKVEIWVNFLWKFIVQLVNDMVSYVWDKQWLEESQDEIRKDIGLKELLRFNK